MVQLRYRTKTLRKLNVRIAGGKSRLHFKLRHGAKHKCKNCGKELKGVPHSTRGKSIRLAISYKKPSRMHGGNLCSSCVKAVIVNMVEGMVQ